MIMQATTSLCSLALPSRPLYCNLLHQRVFFLPRKPLTRATNASFISASWRRDSHKHHYDGKLVDENMIFLRMRIREIEMEEMKSGEAPSSGWTEWEKKYFATYYSDVCDAVGLLQTLLMNTRPSLALGILALVMISMSMSTSFVVFHLVKLAEGIIYI